MHTAHHANNFPLMGGGSQSMSLHMEKLEKGQNIGNQRAVTCTCTEASMHEMHEPFKTQDSLTELSMGNGYGC